MNNPQKLEPTECERLIVRLNEAHGQSVGARMAMANLVELIQQAEPDQPDAFEKLKLRGATLASLAIRNGCDFESFLDQTAAAFVELNLDEIHTRVELFRQNSEITFLREELARLGWTESR